MIERSAGAVILFHDENSNRIEFLLLKHSYGHWDFPKGNVEDSESLKDTAKREIMEETGIEVDDFLNGFERKINYFYTKNGTRVHKEVYFFIFKSNTKSIRLSDEHVSFLWLDYQEAFNVLTFSNAKELLKEAYSFMDNQFL